MLQLHPPTPYQGIALDPTGDPALALGPNNPQSDPAGLHGLTTGHVMLLDACLSVCLSVNRVLTYRAEKKNVKSPMDAGRMRAAIKRDDGIG